MAAEINLEQLQELVGQESIINLLREAAKKAGEDKDWQKAARISEFIEGLQRLKKS